MRTIASVMFVIDEVIMSKNKIKLKILCGPVGKK